MALSAEEKHQIKQEYQREWRNYRQRIRRAEAKGFVIPEKLQLTKVKNPQSWKTVQRIKDVNRKLIVDTIRDKGGAMYTNEKGEVVSRKEADRIKLLESIPKTKSRKYTPFEPDPNRKLSFAEYVEINKKMYDQYSKGLQGRDPELFTDIMIEKIGEMRGYGFNPQVFIQNEEKKGGYLSKDPNRPLEKEEIEYIKRTMITREYDPDDTFSYNQLVEELRGAYFDYQPELQQYNEEAQELPGYVDIIESLNKTEKPTSFNEWANDMLSRDGNIPERIDPPKTSVSSELLETYSYDALYNTVNELIFKSPFAERNREYMLRELRRMRASNDRRAVDNAIKEIAGTEGELFDIQLLYKTGALAQYLFRIERLIVMFSTFYSEDAQQKIDELEANMEEAQENWDEITE